MHEMNTWNRKTLSDMRTERSHFIPFVSGDYIYVFGGRSKEWPCTTSNCERYIIEINFISECFPNVCLEVRRMSTKKQNKCVTIFVYRLRLPIHFVGY